MKRSPRYEFSPQQEASLYKACMIEWISLIYIASVVCLMYIVMGSSQAMKTAWIEDCLSAIPPLCFLLGIRLRKKEPDLRFPYGTHRVVSILYLCAALSLMVMGGYLVGDSIIKLVKMEHPTIGMRAFFGVDIWLGWWMIIVLLWGTFPPILLGRIKLKYAKHLHDKTLYTDGEMNKADWMTAVAAIAGVLGIGMGLWWADAVAAGIIALDIVKDGWSQSKDAVLALLGRAPTSLKGDYLDLPDRIRCKLEDIPWIERAECRLREEGHLIFGDAKILVRQELPFEKVCQLRNDIEEMDWRLKDFQIVIDKSEV